MEAPLPAQATLHDFETTRGTAAALTTIRPREGSVRPPRMLKQVRIDLERLRARGRPDPLAAPAAAMGQDLGAARRCAEPPASPPDRRKVQHFELPLPEGLDDAFEAASDGGRLGCRLAEVLPTDAPRHLQGMLPEDSHLQAAVASVSASLLSDLKPLHPAAVPPSGLGSESPGDGRGRLESADGVRVLLQRERRAFPARTSAPSETPFPQPPPAACQQGPRRAEVGLARARAASLPAVRPSFSATLAGKPVTGRWASWSAIPAALLGKSPAVRSRP